MYVLVIRRYLGRTAADSQMQCTSIRVAGHGYGIQVVLDGVRAVCSFTLHATRLAQPDHQSPLRVPACARIIAAGDYGLLVDGEAMPWPRQAQQFFSIIIFLVIPGRVLFGLGRLQPIIICSHVITSTHVLVHFLFSVPIVSFATDTSSPSSRLQLIFRPPFFHIHAFSKLHLTIR
jgi:hypothetical protein